MNSSVAKSAEASKLNEIRRWWLTRALSEQDRLETTEHKQEVRASIRNALQDATEKVANLNFTSIGSSAWRLFIYTAVGWPMRWSICLTSSMKRPRTTGPHSLSHSLVDHHSGRWFADDELVPFKPVDDYLGGFVSNDLLSRLITHGLSMLASWVLLFWSMP